MKGGFNPISVIRHYYVPTKKPFQYVLSGISMDSVGAALPGCTVNVFATGTNLHQGTTVSDSQGAWTMTVIGPAGMTFFLVEYLAGLPDVAGTSVNTLQATEA